MEMSNMEEISLDGNSMVTKELAHGYLKNRLNLPDYYGENLDALWDILSVHSEPIEIILYNKEKLIENLGQYGQSIIELLKDISQENINISEANCKTA